MTRCNLEIKENKFIDIRYTVNLALQKTRFPREKLLPAVYPLKPVLIYVALPTNKGYGTCVVKCNQDQMNGIKN